jgi:co-chaperonin GroES (HSP10)
MNAISFKPQVESDAPLDPGFTPTEFNVLILPDIVEEKTKGGIILPGSTKDAEQHAAQRGLLVDVSPVAFTYETWPQGSEPPQKGQRVVTGRHVGIRLEGRDGRQYWLCKDKDIAGVES